MKNRRIFKVTAAVLTMAMIVSMLVFPDIPAKCATTNQTKLQADKEYTKYDFTGDGEKDSFTIQRPEYKKNDQPRYRRFWITLNGKKVFEYKCPNPKVYTHLTPILITLKNGKKFLFITCRNGDTHKSIMTGVLQYKDGKFVEVIDFDEYCRRHCNTYKVSIRSIKDNKINFTASMESDETKGYYTGDIIMQFVYKDGTLKQNSAAAHVDKNTAKFIIGINIWTYLSPARKQLCYKLLAGDIVMADECRISAKRIQLRVRRGNIKAWVLLRDGVMDRTLYAEDLKKK